VPDRRQPPRAIDAPEPCFVRLRTTRHGPFIPARIYKTAEGLTAEIDGCEVDVMAVWTSGDVITGEEWMKLIRDRQRPRPF
jgi:hypothetical protein